MHQRAGLNLPSSKPSGVAELVLVPWLAVLLIDGLSLVHTVIYDTYRQTHNQEKEIKVFIVELESEIIKIW